MNEKMKEWLDAIEEKAHAEADSFDGDADDFIQDYYAQTIAKIATRGTPSAQKEKVLELETRAKQTAPEDTNNRIPFLEGFYSSLLYHLVSTLEPNEATDWVAYTTERARVEAHESERDSFITDVYAGAIERIDAQYRLSDQYIGRGAYPLKKPLLNEAEEHGISERDIAHSLPPRRGLTTTGPTEPSGPGILGGPQQRVFANRRPQEAEPPDHLKPFVDEFEKLIEDDESAFEFDDLVEITRWVEYQTSTDTKE